jgi:predicted HicB family RNase H-like nuclease
MKPLPKKTKTVCFKLNPEQYRAIEQRAERCGVSVSVWVRSILTQATKRSDGAPFRLQEPNGATL